MRNRRLIFTSGSSADEDMKNLSKQLGDIRVDNVNTAQFQVSDQI